MRRPLSALLIAALAAVLLVAAPAAAADPPEGGDGSGRGSGNGKPDFVAEGGIVQEVPGMPGLAGDGTTTICTAPNGVTGPIRHEPPPLPQEHYNENASRYFSPAVGQAVVWYMRYCGDAPDQIVAVPGVGPSLALLEDLVDLSVEDPEIRMSPDETGRQLVGLETWLWVDDWGPRSSRPSQRVPGLDIVITATPQKVTWKMGDGSEPFECDKGTAYDPDRPEDEQQPTCSHVYRRSSAREQNGRFTVTATVHWTATVTVNGVERPEVLTADKTSTLPVRVGERQALNRTPRRT